MEHYENGILRQWWDDSATPRTYHEWDASGVKTLTRAFTSEEDARADAEVALAADIATQAAANAEREAARVAVRVILTTITANIDAARAQKTAAQALIDSVAPTNITGAWTKTKDLARIVRDSNDALIGASQGVKDLARLVKDL